MGVKVHIWEARGSRVTARTIGRPMVGPRAAGRSTAVLVALARNVAGGRNIAGISQNRPESDEPGNGNGPNRTNAGRAVGTVRIVGGGLRWLDSDGKRSAVAVLQRLNVGANFNGRDANGSA